VAENSARAAVMETRTVIAAPAADNTSLKYMAVAGCCVYFVLFFFPWVKVVGQEWFALLGYGDKDGFNPFGFLWLMMNLVNVLFEYINLGEYINSDNAASVLFAFAVFFGVLIWPIRSLWFNIKNIFNVAVSPNEDKLKGTAIGPIAFIIGYFFTQSMLTEFITNSTSLGWLGSLAGNAYEQLIQLGAVPWLLAGLGLLNRFLAEKYIRSLKVESNETIPTETPPAAAPSTPSTETKTSRTQLADDAVFCQTRGMAAENGAQAAAMETRTIMTAPIADNRQSIEKPLTHWLPLICTAVGMVLFVLFGGDPDIEEVNAFDGMAAVICAGAFVGSFFAVPKERTKLRIVSIIITAVAAFSAISWLIG
jgi:hypothetical protein